MLFWWPIVKHFSDFLGGRAEFAEPWSIYPGSKGSAKPFPCIEIQWDQEAALSVHKPHEGSIVLWADIWVASDNVGPDDVYRQQYEAQSAIFESLREWISALKTELNLAAKVECSGIVSQGTITRPTFGCRVIINIEWRGGRNYGYTEC